MPKILGPSLEIARIQSEINRLFENLLELKQPGEESGQAWVPNADILDGPESLTLIVELPGVELKDLDLKADGGEIIVRGEKRAVRPEGEGAEFHCLERIYGSFKRVVSLNYPVNTHRAEARLKNGVLKVVFPKVTNRRGGAVPIPVKES